MRRGIEIIADLSPGQSASAVLALAMAAYLNMTPLLLLPPLILLCYDSILQRNPHSTLVLKVRANCYPELGFVTDMPDRTLP